MSAQIDYWRECVAIAAEECGATLTKEQIDCIAGSVQGGHENYGMAFYQPSSSDFYQPKIDNLERELKLERSKVNCKECGGRGRIYTQGPYHGSDSQCWKCHGEGKYVP